MKRSVPVIMGFLTLVSEVAAANTLVWWRFDDVDVGNAFGETRIVNAAVPGTCNGQVYYVAGTKWKQDSSDPGTPYCVESFPLGVKLYDPVTSRYYDNAGGVEMCRAGAERNLQL